MKFRIKISFGNSQLPPFLYLVDSTVTPTVQKLCLAVIKELSMLASVLPGVDLNLKAYSLFLNGAFIFPWSPIEILREGDHVFLEMLNDNLNIGNSANKSLPGCIPCAIDEMPKCASLSLSCPYDVFSVPKQNANNSDCISAEKCMNLDDDDGVSRCHERKNKEKHNRKRNNFSCTQEAVESERAVIDDERRKKEKRDRKKLKKARILNETSMNKLNTPCESKNIETHDTANSIDLQTPEPTKPSRSQTTADALRDFTSIDSLANVHDDPHDNCSKRLRKSSDRHSDTNADTTSRLPSGTSKNSKKLKVVQSSVSNTGQGTHLFFASSSECSDDDELPVNGNYKPYKENVVNGNAPAETDASENVANSRILSDNVDAYSTPVSLKNSTDQKNKKQKEPEFDFRSDVYMNAQDKDFDNLPDLERYPQKGDVIAFKMLELSDRFCPEVSDFKVATVHSFYESLSQVVLKFDKKPVSVLEKPSKFSVLLEEDASNVEKTEFFKCYDYQELLHVKLIEEGHTV